jgi:hypothetical protein
MELKCFLILGIRALLVQDCRFRDTDIGLRAHGVPGDGLQGETSRVRLGITRHEEIYVEAEEEEREAEGELGLCSQCGIPTRAKG